MVQWRRGGTRLKSEERAEVRGEGMMTLMIRGRR
jgi:hypothetical protein